MQKDYCHGSINKGVEASPFQLFDEWRSKDIDADLIGVSNIQASLGNAGYILWRWDLPVH